MTCATIGCIRRATRRGGQLCVTCETRIRRRAEHHCAHIVPAPRGPGARGGGTQHGRHWTYQLGCRCTDCTAANTEACRRWRHARRRLTGAKPAYVDPEPARALMSLLLERGWTREAIARQAGVSRGTLYHLQAGQHRAARTTYEALRRLTERDTADQREAA